VGLWCCHVAIHVSQHTVSQRLQTVLLSVLDRPEPTLSAAAAAAAGVCHHCSLLQVRQGLFQCQGQRWADACVPVMPAALRPGRLAALNTPAGGQCSMAGSQGPLAVTPPSSPAAAAAAAATA
jgi:hypothetical protein